MFGCTTILLYTYMKPEQRIIPALHILVAPVTAMLSIDPAALSRYVIIIVEHIVYNMII